MIYGSQSVRTDERHVVTAPPRIATLNSYAPARIRPGRTLDRRANLEFGLRRSRIVVRKHRVDRAKDLTMALPTRRIPESVAHLNVEIIAAALIRHNANVSNAARALGVPSGDLRKLVMIDQRLARNQSARP